LNVVLKFEEDIEAVKERLYELTDRSPAEGAA
jgi:hypothetical protein